MKSSLLTALALVDKAGPPDEARDAFGRWWAGTLDVKNYGTRSASAPTREPLSPRMKMRAATAAGKIAVNAGLDATNSSGSRSESRGLHAEAALAHFKAAQLYREAGAGIFSKYHQSQAFLHTLSSYFRK